MRLCLACRRLAGNGPICTSCGRSFGGRLCGSKKRHLNPPGSHFCGECGNTNLLEAASSIPFGYLIQILIWGVLLALAFYLGPRFVSQAGVLFTGATGYRDPFVWLFGKVAHFALIFGIVYFLVGLFPGGLGKKLQSLLWNALSKMSGGIVKLIQHGIFSTAKALRHLVSGK